MEKLYVVVDVGCIECGEVTRVLGVFTDENKALEVLKDHAERQRKGWWGHHDFNMYEVDGINQEIRVEYIEH